MSEPQSSRNDPNPEKRKGDSSFLPVVIAAAVAVIVILVAALIFLKIRQRNVVPKANDSRPITRLVQPPPPELIDPQFTIAA